MVDVDLVLAPADGSDEARTAVEYAVAVAGAYGADLHVLFVLEEALAHDLRVGDADAEAVAREHHRFLQSVEEMVAAREDVGSMVTSSVPGYSAETLSRTPGSVILDVAEEVRADFVVLPREAPSGDPEETLGKAALYVLEYASQPVLSV